MPIRYRIVRSKLSTNPDGYVAQVQSYRTVTLDEIADKIAERGTTASKSDVLSVLQHFTDVVEGILRKGEIASIPLGSYYLAIQGTFTEG
jgi:hypothetical protein